MSFGSFEPKKHQPIAEMNVVPLVDVMLVLLVIFIITAPLLTNAVKIDLPKVSSQPNVTRVEHIELAIRTDGSQFWDGELLPPNALPARFAAVAKQNPQPELHIRADRLVAYEKVAAVMAQAARSGMTRIGFVTLPDGS